MVVQSFEFQDFKMPQVCETCTRIMPLYVRVASADHVEAHVEMYIYRHLPGLCFIFLGGKTIQGFFNYVFLSVI